MNVLKIIGSIILFVFGIVFIVRSGDEFKKEREKAEYHYMSIYCFGLAFSLLMFTGVLFFSVFD